MFIRPNEFEAQLTANKAAAAVPVYRRSHRGAGLLFLLMLLPIMCAWLAFLACWTAGAALVRAPIVGLRFLRDIADYSGWLVLR